MTLNWCLFTITRDQSSPNFIMFMSCRLQYTTPYITPSWNLTKGVTLYGLSVSTLCFLPIIKGWIAPGVTFLTFSDPFLWYIIAQHFDLSFILCIPRTLPPFFILKHWLGNLAPNYLSPLYCPFLKTWPKGCPLLPSVCPSQGRHFPNFFLLHI